MPSRPCVTHRSSPLAKTHTQDTTIEHGCRTAPYPVQAHNHRATARSLGELGGRRDRERHFVMRKRQRDRERERERERGRGPHWSSWKVFQSKLAVSAIIFGVGIPLDEPPENYFRILIFHHFIAAHHHQHHQRRHQYDHQAVCFRSCLSAPAVGGSAACAHSGGTSSSLSVAPS